MQTKDLKIWLKRVEREKKAVREGKDRIEDTRYC